MEVIGNRMTALGQSEYFDENPPESFGIDFLGHEGTVIGEGQIRFPFVGPARADFKRSRLELQGPPKRSYHILKTVPVLLPFRDAAEGDSVKGKDQFASFGDKVRMEKVEGLLAVERPSLIADRLHQVGYAIAVIGMGLVNPRIDPGSAEFLLLEPLEEGEHARRRITGTMDESQPPQIGLLFQITAVGVHHGYLG
jgi:hypothetical protein